METITTNIENIEPNPFRDFQISPLNEGLVSSLQRSFLTKDEKGKIAGNLDTAKPVRKHPTKKGKYQLIDQHHRLEAMRRNGETEVKVEIHDFLDREMQRKQHETILADADGTFNKFHSSIIQAKETLDKIINKYTEKTGLEDLRAAIPELSDNNLKTTYKFISRFCENQKAFSNLHNITIIDEGKDTEHKIYLGVGLQIICTWLYSEGTELTDIPTTDINNINLSLKIQKNEMLGKLNSTAATTPDNPYQVLQLTNALIKHEIPKKKQRKVAKTVVTKLKELKEAGEPGGGRVINDIVDEIKHNYPSNKPKELSEFEKFKKFIEKMAKKITKIVPDINQLNTGLLMHKKEGLPIEEIQTLDTAVGYLMLSLTEFRAGIQTNIDTTKQLPTSKIKSVTSKII